MKRLRNIKLMAAIAASFLCLCSCVLEDRDPCPCWLSFKLGDCPESVESVEIYGWRDNTIFSGTKTTDESHPEAYEWSVEKGTVQTCVYSGIRNTYVDDYRVIIPEGYQMDSLYVHRNEVLCEDEFAVDSVVLHKEWVEVRIRLEIENKSYTPSMEEYSFLVVSDIVGFDMLNEQPVYGMYRYIPTLDDNGCLNLRLPRHKRGAKNLFLDVFMNGVHIDRIALGLALELDGFDWEGDSLDNIGLHINITNKNTVLEVLPWEDLGGDNV